MMDTPTSEEGSHASPITDVVEEETAAHQNRLCCNGLSPPNISVLDKLIKTCPVWLQLCMDQQRAAQVLGAEPVGVFLVRKDAELKMLVLSVHISTSDISEYRIKEEKSMLYLEGSALVFEDIFKLVGFYCVSRDVLPFTLRLPHAILEAKTHAELDAISNLGTDFWNSSLNIKAVRTVLPQKGANAGNSQLNSTKSSLHFSHGANQSSCEIELSLGTDRLWFVKPIFIEECSNVLPHDKPSLESKTANAQASPARPSYRRPPPPPPPISGALKTVKKCSPVPELSSGGGQPNFGKPNKEMEADRDELRKGPGRMERCMSETAPKKCVYPVIPPRRRSTGKYSEDLLVDVGKMETNGAQDKEENKLLGVQSTPDSNNSEVAANVLVDVSVKMSEDSLVTSEEYEVGQIVGEHGSCNKSKPLPPPRKKRLSHQLTSASLTPTVEESIDEEDVTELANLSLGDSQKKCNIVIPTYNGDPACDGNSSPESKKSSTYLINPGLNSSGVDLDSLSTSSTEDDLERANSRPIKKTHSIMLDRAKSRLSLVNLSSVFSAFLSADRKLQKKIIELAQDKESYFGHLVQDYKSYSLEMMAKHSSSTEMLQEIRLMMTQLKSYLLQSAELQTIIDPAVHKEEKIEVIAEAALCKCVLKPLKEAIDSHLCIIHTNSGALRLMKENQQVIQGTTTTELGVTTSVPEAIVIDKILNKFTAMHKAYSPEKKIAFLLKACKLIYDSMSTGTPGKSYGADDFLPVLMYVLARCSLYELLLDVEYMMELMDPALQLGEGSYYLTTTYGALEHIKNYDKVTMTRQLSMEVQDSIHRWEKRRTLSKTRVSRTSVQDFITIAFQEPDSQTRTLAIKPDTCAELLAHQCALKFEVAEPHRYGLFILVDERCLLLASDAQPHRIKSYLLKCETKKYFNFVYKEIGIDEAATAQIIKEPNFLE